MSRPTRFDGSIDLRDTGLPARVQSLRLARGWTRADLAQAAGLSTRTVRDLETGRRERVQDKTVLLIATALDATLEDLLPERMATGEPAPAVVHDGDDVVPERARPAQWTRWTRWWWPVAAAAVLAAGFFALDSRIEPELALVDGRLFATHGVFGHALWSLDRAASVRFVTPDPEHDDHILVALNGDAPDGGRVLRIHRSGGEVTDELLPDMDLARHAFGPTLAQGVGDFHATRLRFVQLDGEGPEELIVQFQHNRAFPTVLMAFSVEGEPIGAYGHRGHVFALHVDDIDGDGRDDVIAAGTDNHPAHQGGTLIWLDADHWSGASIDPGPNPGGRLSDGARVRVISPNFDPQVRHVLGGVRVSATSIVGRQDGEGRPRIVANFGMGDAGVLVTFDGALRPIAVRATDLLLGRLRGATRAPLDPDRFPGAHWAHGWLSGFHRFTCGHPECRPATR